MRSILVIWACITTTMSIAGQDLSDKEKALLESRAARRAWAQDPAIHQVFRDIVGVPKKTPWTWKVTHCATSFNDPVTFEKLWLGDIARRVGTKDAAVELGALKKGIAEKYKTTPHVLFQALLTYKESREALFLNEEDVKILVSKLEADDIVLQTAGKKKTDPNRKFIADGLKHLRAQTPMLKLGDPIVLADEAKADGKK